MKILFIVVSLLAVGESRAAEVLYKVTEVSGNFFAWRGLEVGWSPVVLGAFYEENALVQSLGAGNIVLKEQISSVGDNPKVIIVESPGRSIFRIGKEVMRKVKLSTNFVKSTDTGVSDDKEDADFDISSIWRKIASLGKANVSSVKGADNTKVGGDESKAELAAKSRYERIEFRYPSKGGVLVPQQLPLTVPLIWEHLGKAEGCYEIFLKSAVKTVFERVGVAQEKRFDLKISEAGNYVVRVQCSSGRAASEEHAFNVLPADSVQWQAPVSVKERLKRKP
jgi:hypothetical protein